jgi:DNA modification methylase
VGGWLLDWGSLDDLHGNDGITVDGEMSESFLNGRVQLYRGDCLEVLPTLEECSIDSCVTDPPYHLTSIVKRFGSPNAAPVKLKKLDGQGGSPYARGAKGFMGKQWDGGDIAFRPELWAKVYRVLKPGAHLLAFSGTRTYHRMACAIEDAGFEIRDQIGWCYGSGFPKSHNVAVAIDKQNGIGPRSKAFNMKGRGDRAEELDTNGREFLPPYEAQTDSAIQWQGWGTALKPAWEPIVLARKPLSESSIAANVLKHSVGALNIDGCRIGTGEPRQSMTGGMGRKASPVYGQFARDEVQDIVTTQGRWPANLIHDGSEEVLAGFPDAVGMASQRDLKTTPSNYFGADKHPGYREGFNDSGSAARFFYTAKADADDRLGSKHPTVKPIDLIQYLVRLVTPKGGVVLDPFGGTGTTGEAAYREGFKAVLVEREEEYQSDIVKRMGLCLSGPDERRRETIKHAGLTADAGPLFGGGQHDGQPRRRNVAAGFEGEERKKRLRGVCGREGLPE